MAEQEEGSNLQLACQLQLREQTSSCRRDVRRSHGLLLRLQRVPIHLRRFRRSGLVPWRWCVPSVADATRC